MFWFIFAISGAFFTATYSMLVKKLVKDINQYVLASGVFLSSFVVLLIISALKGIPEIGPNFYSAVLATGVLNVVAVALQYRALKITDLSLAIPMLSFSPIFLIFTSFILLRELPSMLGAMGIVLIVIGSYIINITKDNTGLLDPLKEIFRNKGTFYMLIVAFLFSISVNFDKLVMKNSDPIFGLAIVCSFIGLSFLIISILNRYEIKKVYRINIHKFFIVGIVFALIGIAINIAYTMQIVPYVISIKRLSILFSVFYGGLMFKEKNIVRRSLGASIMLAGVILIILF